MQSLTALLPCIGSARAALRNVQAASLRGDLQRRIPAGLAPIPGSLEASCRCRPHHGERYPTIIHHFPENSRVCSGFSGSFRSTILPVQTNAATAAAAMLFALFAPVRSAAAVPAAPPPDFSFQDQFTIIQAHAVRHSLLPQSHRISVRDRIPQAQAQ